MAQREQHPGRKIARLERKVNGLIAVQRTVAQLSRHVLHKLELELSAAREQRDLAETLLTEVYVAMFGENARSEALSVEDIAAELLLGTRMLEAACDRLDELGYRYDATGAWLPREPAEDDATPHAMGSARRTLLHLGYTFTGGAQWRPPVGPKPKYLEDELVRPLIGKASLRKDRHRDGWICSGWFGGDSPALVFGDGPTPQSAYESMFKIAWADGDA